MTPLNWLDLLFRWAHIIAAIAWIGSSFYFIWLDSKLEKPDPPQDRVEGHLWMVHSGGFYEVVRRVIGPGQVPKTLHWFKWEAGLTWITGFFLLGIVYYSTRGLYLIDPDVADINVWSAAGIGMGAVIASWVVYDAIWRSPLRDRPAVATLLCYVLFAGLAYGLCHALSGRAAFIHVGVALGTIMVANVWNRILPAQSRMIRATHEGYEPDLRESASAKTRSVHNSYITFPVVFIMISNHFPATYAHPLNWVVLGLFMVVGGGVRHLMIGQGVRKHWMWVPVGAAFIALVLMTAPMRQAGGDVSLEGPTPSFAQARAVITSRCQICHSATPADDTFGPMPGGVSFDDDADIVRLSDRIFVRAVLTRTMPLANRTKITDEERLLLGRWVENGAGLD